MKALIFNGALESRENSVSAIISDWLHSRLAALGIQSHVYNIIDSGIPLFDTRLTNVPKSVELMNLIFREADVHIWLSPLYHGSMTGAMKNTLDWLECSSKYNPPYLTGKKVGLVCWADGVQAMQGINAMDAVVKSLRAWPVPYSVPIQRGELYAESTEIAPKYQERLDLLVNLLVQGPDHTPNPKS